MLYREIIAVCSEIHTKHINTLCGQNVGSVNVKPGGIYTSIVTTGLHSVEEKRMDMTSSRTGIFYDKGRVRSNGTVWAGLFVSVKMREL
jgi:hypothetical protein